MLVNLIKKMDKNKKNKSTIIKVALLVGILLALTYITIKAWPFIISLKDESTQQNLKEYINNKGVWGVLIVLAMQVIQVIIAVIPGEIIEVAAGVLYGTIGGYLICTIGMLAGTIIIYYSVKTLGASFVNKMVNSEKLAKYEFLHNSKKLEIITFILFFIPGTPKDLLTYFMPFTSIKPSRLFLIITVARVPSIISSTFAGASIGDGKWTQSIIVFLIIGIVGLVGIGLNEKIIAFLNKEKQKIKNVRNKHKDNKR